jgi:hypothetical protein
MYMYGDAGTDIELFAFNKEGYDGGIRLVKDLGKKDSTRIMTLGLKKDKPGVSVKDSEGKIVGQIP